MFFLATGVWTSLLFAIARKAKVNKIAQKRIRQKRILAEKNIIMRLITKQLQKLITEFEEKLETHSIQ